MGLRARQACDRFCQLWPHGQRPPVTACGEGSVWDKHIPPSSSSVHVPPTALRAPRAALGPGSPAIPGPAGGCAHSLRRVPVSGLHATVGRGPANTLPHTKAVSLQRPLQSLIPVGSARDSPGATVPMSQLRARPPGSGPHPTDRLTPPVPAGLHIPTGPRDGEGQSRRRPRPLPRFRPLPGLRPPTPVTESPPAAAPSYT